MVLPPYEKYLSFVSKTILDTWGENKPKFLASLNSISFLATVGPVDATNEQCADSHERYW